MGAAVDITRHPTAAPCNFYCRPPRHATPMLVEPWLDRAAILEGTRAHFQQRRWHLVDAQPAREADRAEWQAFCTRRLYPDGSMTPCDASPTAVPWLVFLERMPDDCEG